MVEFLDSFKLNLRISVWLIVLMPIVSAKLPMPNWLKQRTGLTTWPGYEAPYVAEPHHNLARIPDNAIRAYGVCNSEDKLAEACSYDCVHCIRQTDITSCDILSQTFDDGPSLSTPRLLDHLKKMRTKSTFFLLGVNIVEHPHIAIREFKEGHLLGAHTWSHKFLPSLTNEEVFAELQWSIWAINASTGVVPKYFRPPYGGLDDRIRNIANQLNLHTVLWDRDTSDWQIHSGTRTKSDILKDVNTWAKDHPSRKWYQFKAPKAKGLILEHDLSDESVSVALEILGTLKSCQKRLDKCVKSPPRVPNAPRTRCEG